MEIVHQTTIYGNWLASPSAENERELMIVGYRGYVTRDDLYMDGECARPLVHLRSDIKLKKNSATGIWEKVN